MNNRLIFIVAISFSLLVNVPRIVFLFGNNESLAASFLGVSIQDTLFRIVSLFGFCYTLLKLNIDWTQKWFQKHALLKSTVLNILAFIVWIVLFGFFDVVMNSGESSTLSPRFNHFVYLFVMIMILIISRAILLNNKSKADALEKEQLKHQSLQNELSALRNQVNPHFLFNSLNSLSLLVREDQDSAGKFINKLSFLYRYILQSKDQDLVTIKEELKFLESYIYLIKQRYQHTFSAKITIDKALYNNKSPTLALQLLVENAVKHNEISTVNPLKIDVYDEKDWLVVTNKLQQRKGNIESTYTGLSNLSTRFKLLVSKDIVILKDHQNFTVKIPIL